MSKIIYYYQTFIGLDDILSKSSNVVTHIHLSSIHFGTDQDNTPYIHLNDYSPENPIFDNLWKELDIAKSLNIKIILMIGGAGGAFNTLFSNFNLYYPLLKKIITKYECISGVDLDVEENTSLADIKMLIKEIKKDFGINFIVSMAPVAYALESDTPGMGGFMYKDLFNSEEGKYIDYFNGQFYYDFCEKAYQNVINNGYPAEKIIFGMESGQNIENVKIMVEKLVKKYPNFGGVFDWEYFNADGDKNPYDWALAMKDAMNMNSYCSIS